MNYAFKMCLLISCVAGCGYVLLPVLPAQEISAPDSGELHAPPEIPPWGGDGLPDAETVLDNCMLAAGGHEVLGSRGITRFVSELGDPADRPYTYESYRSDHQACSIISYRDGRVRQRGVISDGTLNKDGSRFGFAWEIYDGQVREIHGDELQLYLRQRIRIKSDQAPDRRFKSATCIGREKVRDREAFKLLIVDHDGFKITLYYDTQTWLCLRRVCKEEFGAVNREVIRDYTGYKWNGELMYATENHISYSGKTDVHTTTAYETNIEPPPGIFDVPTELAAKIGKAMTANRLAKEQTKQVTSPLVHSAKR